MRRISRICHGSIRPCGRSAGIVSAVLTVFAVVAGCENAPRVHDTTEETTFSNNSDERMRMERAPDIECVDASGSQCHPLRNADGRANCVMFLMTDCPICNTYAPEIARIIDAYSRNTIHFSIVYVDDHISTQKARTHAKDHGLSATILLDDSHQLSKAVGATVAPEVAVVSADGDILYRGRIDDLYVDYGKKRMTASTHELRDALDAIGSGHTVSVARTTAVGCYIPE
ncbi:MAG TPA: redoxin family protein [Phycisphaerales bacterium]|nr:redoxin family protein [Phycisphaerales bacterium]